MPPAKGWKKRKANAAALAEREEAEKRARDEAEGGDSGENGAGNENNAGAGGEQGGGSGGGTAGAGGTGEKGDTVGGSGEKGDTSGGTGGNGSGSGGGGGGDDDGGGSGDKGATPSRRGNQDHPKRGEIREIPCLPCLKSWLRHTENTDECRHQTQKCSLCCNGRAGSNCVPIHPLLQVFASKLRQLINDRADNTQLCHYRTTIRKLMEHLKEVEEKLKGSPMGSASDSDLEARREEHISKLVEFTYDNIDGELEAGLEWIKDLAVRVHRGAMKLK